MTLSPDSTRTTFGAPFDVWASTGVGQPGGGRGGGGGGGGGGTGGGGGGAGGGCGGGGAGGVIPMITWGGAAGSVPLHAAMSMTTAVARATRMVTKRPRADRNGFMGCHEAISKPAIRP